jgi:hypothetical protein
MAECVGVFDTNSFYRLYFVKNLKKLKLQYWDAQSEDGMLGSLEENPTTTVVLVNSTLLSADLVQTMRAASSALKIVAFSNGIDDVSICIVRVPFCVRLTFWCC